MITNKQKQNNNNNKKQPHIHTEEHWNKSFSAKRQNAGTTLLHSPHDVISISSFKKYLKSRSSIIKKKWFYLRHNKHSCIVSIQVTGIKKKEKEFLSEEVPINQRFSSQQCKALTDNDCFQHISLHLLPLK